jgi:hypothetical protein
MTAASIRESMHTSTSRRPTNGISRLTATARSPASSRIRRIDLRSQSAGTQPSLRKPPACATVIARSGPARPPPMPACATGNIHPKAVKDVHVCNVRRAIDAAPAPLTDRGRLSYK